MCACFLLLLSRLHCPTSTYFLVFSSHFLFPILFPLLLLFFDLFFFAFLSSSFLFLFFFLFLLLPVFFPHHSIDVIIFLCNIFVLLDNFFNDLTRKVKNVKISFLHVEGKYIAQPVHCFYFIILHESIRVVGSHNANCTQLRYIFTFLHSLSAFSILELGLQKFILFLTFFF